MNRHTLTLAVAGLLAVASGAPAQLPPFENSYALIIAVRQYQSPKFKVLDSATKDANAVSSFLRAQGFQILPLYDQRATKVGIISEMQRLARRVGKRDRVLVYFAGHGYTETFGELDYGYIVPYDGGDDSATYISMEELQTQSQKMDAAAHQLFIMDSCFGGLLSLRDSVGVNPMVPNYIEEISRRPARQVITAGGKNQQVVSNGPNGYSVFAGALLEAVEQRLADTNSDGYVTFSELMSYLQKRASNAYQTPAAGMLPRHGLGEFVFRVGSTPTQVTPPPIPLKPPNVVFRDPEPVDVQTAIKRVLTDYRAAYESKDVDELLRVFPSFQGARDLRARLADLQSVAMALGPATIKETSLTSAIATCAYSLTYTSRTGAIEQTKPMRAEFTLRLEGRNWEIQSLRFN